MADLTGIFITFVFSLMVYCCKKKSNNSPITNWPVIGMVAGAVGNANRIHEYIAQVLKASGYTFRFKGLCLANMDYLITSDPANVHYILSRNFDNYNKRPKFKEIAAPMGDGIFVAEDESRKIQIKIIHSLIKGFKFQSTLEKVVCEKVEKGLMDVLDHVSESGLVVDLQDVLQRFNFDINCGIVLGFDPNSLSPEFPTCVYRKSHEVIEEGILRRHIVPGIVWKLQKWLQIGEEKKFLRAWENFDRFLYNCIALKRQNHEEEGEFDLLTAMLASEEDKALSDKFLRDMAFNIIGAGKDTITSALVWTLWLVSTHPLVETKILEEIKRNLDDKSVEEVNRLVYLHAVLCETMRLYPPVPFNHKAATQADILPSGHQVDPNSTILISFYSMGRMEQLWGKDCLEFKPERWISDQGRINYFPSYQFASFNAGPKACLGKDMAFIVMKIVASAIIWNYKIQVVEDHIVVPKPSMVLLLDHGLKVRVFRREF